MKLVVFGLTVSSSWGNGHATLWRGLCRAWARNGHRTVFFERDQPWYAEHRDLAQPPGVDLRLYRDWGEVRAAALAELADADAAMVTSYCPDGPAASDAVLASKAAVRAFYDMDTPITLDRLQRGLPVEYLPREGLGGFDVVLSFTGGSSLDALKKRLGARHAVPLYGSVDPEAHSPCKGHDALAGDLSYLGTYAEDRQVALERLFVEPARRRSECRFVVGGALYPPGTTWPGNVVHLTHVPPPRHPEFYCSSPLTLNVTRRAMAATGWCPSPRLFEAAACGTAIVSDRWPGLEAFFEPGREILVCESTRDVLEALDLPRAELARIARAARERTLAEHTATRRAAELEAILEQAARGGA